jgi:hypothetical protein
VHPDRRSHCSFPDAEEEEEEEEEEASSVIPEVIRDEMRSVGTVGTHQFAAFNFEFDFNHGRNAKQRQSRNWKRKALHCFHGRRRITTDL